MSLSKGMPLRELRGMRKKMDSVFEELLFIGRNDSLSIQNRGLTWTPMVEIQEIDDELILKVKVPGIDVNDLEVKVDQNQVTISGEYHKEEANENQTQSYFYSEFNYGKFQRVVPLPISIKVDEVECELKKGILTLNLPKLEEVHQKVFKIKLEAERSFSPI